MDDEGVVNSAVLLMALGEDTASEVFKHLGPKEVQRIGEAMAKLKTTTREKVDAVLDKFHAEAGRNGSLVEDTDQYVRNVLVRALGEDKAGMLLDRILQGGDVSGIESLKWMDAVSVSELIRNEHPQIIASILVHLERDQSCDILMQFPERLRADVVLRIATLDGIQPNALRELNDVLAKVLAGGDRIKKAKLGGSKTAAEILNFMGGNQDAAVIETIRESDPDLAQKILDQMFTFDDLLKLDDRGIQAVLREVQTDQLVIALKSADPDLREKILRNMSQRAAEGLREDLESRGPVKVSEVEAQQKEILKTVRRLAEEGQISIGGGGEDAFV
ncbi:MAG TPA: flagellar motor switch protein FliG [Quisquiliibacterium sp.]|nr:flagellar motor switch protein FliG [Quisquiliibacterium sp.]HQD84159.1 flagellar motor switch protein FliG [Quisquiliibacterium sp.]HQP66438.1 flagellar motor switch protein FliG [Quisquiliibacterium sp.]